MLDITQAEAGQAPPSSALQATIKKSTWIKEILRTTNLTPRDKVVGIRLVEFYAHKKGHAWPSVATLAKECAIGSTACKEAIVALAMAGFIIVRSGHKTRTRNEYVPAWDAKAVAASETTKAREARLAKVGVRERIEAARQKQDDMVGRSTMAGVPAGIDMVASEHPHGRTCDHVLGRTCDQSHGRTVDQEIVQPDDSDEMIQKRLFSESVTRAPASWPPAMNDTVSGFELDGSPVSEWVTMTATWQPAPNQMDWAEAVYADAAKAHMRMPFPLATAIERFRSYHVKKGTTDDAGFSKSFKWWITNDRTKATRMTAAEIAAASAPGELIPNRWWPAPELLEQAAKLHGSSTHAWVFITSLFRSNAERTSARSEDWGSSWLSWLGSNLARVESGQVIDLGDLPARETMDELWLPSSRTLRTIMSTFAPFKPKDFLVLQRSLDGFIEWALVNHPKDTDAAYLRKLTWDTDAWRVRFSGMKIDYVRASVGAPEARKPPKNSLSLLAA